MIDTSPECETEMRRVRKGLLRLELFSQADSQAFNPAPAADPTPPRWRIKDNAAPIPHIGQRGTHTGDTQIPTGGIKRHDDKQFDYRQKSRAFFDSRLERWSSDPHRKFGLSDIQRLAVEIEDTIYDWQHTPHVAGVQHDRDTFLWKCEVADAKGTTEEVMRKYVVSKRTLERYRNQFRGIKKKAA